MTPSKFILFTKLYLWFQVKFLLNRACCISSFLSVKEWLKNATVSTWSGNPIFSTASTNLCICTTLTCPLHSTSLALLSTKFYSSQPCGPYHSLIWCGAGNRALSNSPSVTRCFERSPCPSCLPSFQVVKPYLQAMEEKPFLLPVMQKQKDK